MVAWLRPAERQRPAAASRPTIATGGAGRIGATAHPSSSPTSPYLVPAHRRRHATAVVTKIPRWAREAISRDFDRLWPQIETAILKHLGDRDPEDIPVEELCVVIRDVMTADLGGPARLDDTDPSAGDSTSPEATGAFTFPGPQHAPTDLGGAQATESEAAVILASAAEIIARFEQGRAGAQRSLDDLARVLLLGRAPQKNT